MYIKNFKEKITHIEVVTGFLCDNCRKTHNNSDMPKDWYYFTIEHTSLDGDDFDLFDEFMVCSPFCYIETLTEILRRINPYKPTKIDNMSLTFAKSLVLFYGVK